jgi:hypothetical protein
MTEEFFNKLGCPTATLSSSVCQGFKDALPEAGGAPQPIALVRRLPLAARLGHRAPRGARAHHPEDGLRASRPGATIGGAFEEAQANVLQRAAGTRVNPAFTARSAFWQVSRPGTLFIPGGAARGMSRAVK